jgi:hypothetical protein
MPMYIYHAQGHPVGFLFGNFIHDLEGSPLGRVLGSHVHRLDGTYVGEWFKETVVAKPAPSRRDIQPIAAPERRPTPGPTSSRRGVVDYGYPDVFHLLYQGGQASIPEEDELLLDVAAE